jgi:hypothetical protein
VSGGLIIASGAIFCLLGLINLEANFHTFDWSAGFDPLTFFPTFGDGLVAVVIGLFLIRAGRAIWIGRS